MAIPMFDVDQVEVFKGGQSFAFGQNALAGIIKINLNKPKPIRETKVMFEVGSFDKTNLNFVYNQPITQSINLRLSISKNNDNGFIFTIIKNDINLSLSLFVIKFNSHCFKGT